MGTVAVTVGVITVVSALLLVPASVAAEPRSASSALTELAITDAPRLGVSGFTGTYGTAGAAGPGSLPITGTGLAGIIVAGPAAVLGGVIL